MFPRIKPYKKPIYLDYAATTPVEPVVIKAMAPFWQEKFGNPSSLYKQGIEARRAVEASRKTIADLIGARPQEIIFTAGGTESINLAIFGVVKNPSLILPFKRGGDKRAHIITTKIEHHAVLKSCEALAEKGTKITYVGVDNQGFVNLDELKKAIRSETVLVSVMYANNEIGTIEPIEKISKLLRQVNLQRAQKKMPRILFHTDACQAAGALDINVNRLGVDLMTLNGSKIYGPKQAGILYVRSGVKLEPIIYGGGQERNLRSGTENVPGVVGLAKALELAKKNKAKENLRLQELRDNFIKQILKKVPSVSLNGTSCATAFAKASAVKKASEDKQGRLANNINICVDGVEGEALMLYLDGYNIAASTGSACATSLTGPSHVIMALGKSAKEAQSSIRMTLGKFTTKPELDYVLKVLPGVVAELRRVQK